MNPASAFAGGVLITALVTAFPARAEVVRTGQPVMGTVLTVTIVGEDRAKASQLADAALEEARRWDDALTIWRPEGELARLNAKAGQGPVEVSERLALGLVAMRSLAADTGGAFEPAVATLRLPGARPTFPLRGIGSAMTIDAMRARLDAGSALDPGAIGKGLALDAIVALLVDHGVKAAFLDFGGSSQTAIGVAPGNAEGWPVLVAGLAQGTPHGQVMLRDASLSTSRAGAEDTTPIIDPRSGEPVPAPRMTTVLTHSAAAADAWSTALVVRGREGLAAARRHGVEALLEDANGVVRTGGFAIAP